MLTWADCIVTFFLPALILIFFVLAIYNSWMAGARVVKYRLQVVCMRSSQMDVISPPQDALHGYGHMTH